MGCFYIKAAQGSRYRARQGRAAGLELEPAGCRLQPAELPAALGHELLQGVAAAAGHVDESEEEVLLPLRPLVGRGARLKAMSAARATCSMWRFF